MYHKLVPVCVWQHITMPAINIKMHTIFIIMPTCVWHIIYLYQIWPHAAKNLCHLLISKSIKPCHRKFNSSTMKELHIYYIKWTISWLVFHYYIRPVLLSINNQKIPNVIKKWYRHKGDKKNILWNVTPTLITLPNGLYGINLFQHCK